MNPDPKAPLPDEVEKAIDFVSDAFRHEFREAKSDPDAPYFCALKTIRAHIAAQRNEVEQMAEKIAELEAEKETAAKLIRKYSDGGVSLFNRLKELEADNKRLREQLADRFNRDWCDTREAVNKALDVYFTKQRKDIMKALAQHDASCASTEHVVKPAPCKTCGITTSIYETINGLQCQKCGNIIPTCNGNGTGLEVK